MSVFIDGNTRLLIQGITGRDGSFHAWQMMEYGTQVAGGVTPGKGGQSFDGPNGAQVPIFDTMDAAVRETGANASVIYVPPPFAASSASFAVSAPSFAAPSAPAAVPPAPTAGFSVPFATPPVLCLLLIIICRHCAEHRTSLEPFRPRRSNFFRRRCASAGTPQVLEI